MKIFTSFLLLPRSEWIKLAKEVGDPNILQTLLTVNVTENLQMDFVRKELNATSLFAVFLAEMGKPHAWSEFLQN